MDLRRRVLSHLSQHGSIDAQSFKELTGLTRKIRHSPAGILRP